jgi:hypothetical protein
MREVVQEEVEGGRVALALLAPTKRQYEVVAPTPGQQQQQYQAWHYNPQFLYRPVDPAVLLVLQHRVGG